jgi:hypothetical protein
MKLALEELGYKKVYHFFEVSENLGHTQRWIEALESKFPHNETKPKTRPPSYWHELFEDYNVYFKLQLPHGKTTDQSSRQ